MGDYVTPEEMAAMHNLAINTIYRILRADAKRKPQDRQIQGAVKKGDKFRGVWRIPRTVAEAYKPRPKRWRRKEVE